MSAVAAGGAGFEIAPLAEVPIDRLLDALDRTFGPGHDEAWFAWKHRGNPFGPSFGWAAVGAGGEVLGVRLLMRWRLAAAGEEIEALRPVDTATVPGSRRRGVFRALAERAVEGARDAGAALLFNNPNRSSRPAYRALGWTLLPPLATAWRPVGPGAAARLVEDGEALAAIASAHGGAEVTGHRPGAAAGLDARARWATARSPGWLSWRFGPGSGRRYAAARLAEADAANGIVYRVEERRGLRLLVTLELAGAPRERRRLALAAARRERARVLVAATGEGTVGGPGGLAIRRRGPVLAVRALAPLDPDPLRRGSWALGAGDLEGVI